MLYPFNSKGRPVYQLVLVMGCLPTWWQEGHWLWSTLYRLWVAYHLLYLLEIFLTFISWNIADRWKWKHVNLFCRISNLIQNWSSKNFDSYSLHSDFYCHHWQHTFISIWIVGCLLSAVHTIWWFSESKFLVFSFKVQGKKDTILENHHYYSFERG